MRPRQTITGLLVLVLGLLLLIGATVWLPKSPEALVLGSLGNEENATLPPEVLIPSLGDVVVSEVPAGDSLAGNFSTGPGGTLLSFYVLSFGDWSAFNRSLSSGETTPPSFDLGVANSAGASWGPLSSGGAPLALLYLGPSSTAPRVWENVTFTPPAGPPSGEVPGVPPSLVLLVEPALDGRSVFLVPALTSATWGFGVQLNLSPSIGTSAEAFAISPNATSSCSATLYLPSDKDCQEVVRAGPVLGPTGGTGSFFTRARGVLSGWQVLVLSTFVEPTHLSLNQTSSDFSGTVVLGASSLTIALGAGLGFFGFLAFTGGLVSRPRIQERGEGAEGAAEAAHPGLSVELGLAVEGIRSPSPPAVPALAAVEPQSTCGICGTGYPSRKNPKGCPVCGSRSVVFTPPTGLELK